MAPYLLSFVLKPSIKIRLRDTLLLKGMFKILCVPVQCVPTYLIFVFDTEPRLTPLSAAEVVPVKLWPWHRLFVLFCCFSALKVEQNAETRTALLWCPDEQRSALRFLEKLRLFSPNDPWRNKTIVTAPVEYGNGFSISHKNTGPLRRI